MARRGPKKKPKLIDYSDPQSLIAYKAAFCEWMTLNHFSPHTLRVRCNDLDTFIRWCEERGVTQAVEVNPPIVEQYRRYLYHYRKADNAPLSLRTQSHRLISVRTFFKWLAKKNYILFNPAAELELPRIDKQLPQNLLTHQEVEQVINQPKVSEPLGIRDRAILETFYSTGIRRTELINLRLYDLGLDQGTLMVRLGKGRKDRVVPIGDRALKWIDKYLIEVRPHWVMEPDEGYLFITIDGDPLSQNRLSDLARGYIQAAGINKPGSCHVFRHAMATHMLENGADIRIIQAILGHEALSTTETYTHVSIQHIKAVHTDTHPARLTRKQTTTNDGNADKQTLLSALAAEATEETDTP